MNCWLSTKPRLYSWFSYEQYAVLLPTHMEVEMKLLNLLALALFASCQVPEPGATVAAAGNGAVVCRS